MKKRSILLLAVLIGVFIIPVSPVSAANPPPIVIPNIQQWVGGEGTFDFLGSGRICYEDDELATTANVFKDDLYSFTNVEHTVVKTSTPSAGDIFLTLDCSDSSIGNEGYLMDIGDYITISANEDAGVFYGTRTLLQILKQDLNHISVPKGSIKDYPKYEIRGFMLDVARKYFTPRYLENYIKQMAWLKMNKFHLHFTDDQGFRLKSDIYPNLSFDLGYSKQYLSYLQDFAARYHVTIIPEIDLPGHASAIVNAYPETGHTPGTSLNPATSGLRPIDLSKQASWDIAYGLLDEFVPLFDSPYFHIGADEYPGYGPGEGLNSLLEEYPELLAKAQSMGLETEADLYYYFINSMGDYVESNYGKKAIFWEWCERFEPYTSIQIENDMIFDAWEGPEGIKRSQQGFDIINSNWRATYIVPGTNMYPDMKILYERWQPYWLDLQGNVKLEPDDTNLRGVKFHNWNDHAGVYNEGGLDRFTLLPMKVMAEKMWGAPIRASLSDFKEDVNTLGNVPGHGVDLVGAWKFEELEGIVAKDTSGYIKNAIIDGPVRIDEGKYGRGLLFDNNDVVHIGEPDISGSWTVSLWINATSSNGNAIIMDSENTSLKLEQGTTGKVGFTDKQTSQDYVFDYSVQPGEWTNLAFVGTESQTSLYVDGDLIDTVSAGVMCPMDTIGSYTDGVNGSIDEVKVYARELSDEGIISVMNGMVMDMPFECSDEKVVQDVSGALYHGVIKSPARRTDNGRVGKGILLSNRNSEIVLCHDDISGPWTVSIWVNKEPGSLGGPLLRSYLSAIKIGPKGNPMLTIHGVKDYPFSTVISDDTWTHLTLTSDGVSQTSLYVNGVYKETINNTISLPLITLGYWWQAFNGVVDELQVYDRVLDDDEIADLVGYVPAVDEVTTNSVTLSWNDKQDAEGYNLYRSLDPDTGYEKLNDEPITGTRYFDYGLVKENTYYYRLTYIISGIESGFSDRVSVTIPEEILLSLKKPSTSAEDEPGYEAHLANDGNPATYWGGGIAPKWWQVDLLGKHNIKRIVVRNYVDGSRYYTYNVEASADGVNWTRIAEKTNTNVAIDEGDEYIVNIVARYIRVNMTGSSKQGYVHISECSVYGEIGPAPVPTDGLAGYWNFDEGSGDTAADTSGNDNHGSIYDATWTDSGISGGSLYFDGDDDHIVLTNQENIQTPWTLSLWIKREITHNNAAILMNSPSGSIRLEQVSSRKLGFTVPGAGDYSFNYLAEAGQWTHIALVGTDNGTLLFINGIYKQMLPISTSCPMQTIGRETKSIKGTLDEVRVYNRALEINEIRTLAGVSAPVNEELMEAVDALEIGFALGDSAERVTRNLSLPLNGINGTTVTWESSSTEVISVTGEVSRPTDADVVVVLTATVSKEEASAAKIFTLVVKKDDGLIGYWNFNEGTGNTAADLSGNGNDGIINGPTWITEGIEGNALHFDGGGDIVSFMNPGSISPSWTVSVWVKRENSSANAAVLMNSTTSSLRLEQVGSKRIGYTLNGKKDHSFSVAASVDEWMHLAYVGTNNGVSLYVDGQYIETMPTVIDCPMVTIGRNTLSFKGAIDELAIYDRELGPYEIAVLAGVMSPDEAEAAMDADALEIGFTDGDSPERVTARLLLPEEGEHGSTIVWQSDYVNIISNDGRVNTSGIQGDSVDVDLVAAISKGSATIFKNFTVTVIKPVSQGKTVTSNFDMQGHEAVYAIDGIPETYWDGIRSDDGAAWLQIDLEDTYKIYKINIANYADGNRYYKYYIKVSKDGNDWVPVAAKNSTDISTDTGDSFDVNVVARYVRIYTTENSVSEYSVHICEAKIFGEAYDIPVNDTISVNDFTLDKAAYLKGDTVKASFTIKNNSDSGINVNEIKIRRYGLTDRMVYSEATIASDIAISAWQEHMEEDIEFWDIPGSCENGAYGFWISTELSNGEVYDSYVEFTRVIDDLTLLTYDVNMFDYNGLNVYALDGGMSAEAAVEKSLENLDSGVSHTWYVQSNGGPNFVYSSKNFLEESINKTVDLYNTYLGETTTFDAVIFATGNCGINYLSRVTKAPVLPVQFLVSVDTYKELRTVIDSAMEAGIDCYSTLGHDLSMGKGVAWVKLLDLPQAYKDFLIQHDVKNVIIAATTCSVDGESTARKALESDTQIEGTNPGDIYILYPNGHSEEGRAIDNIELSKCLRDYKEVNLEEEYYEFSDWESGMVQSQFDSITNAAISTIGSEATVLELAADGSQALYNYGSYAVCKFYQKNTDSEDDTPINGIVMNPYLIGHPAYETMNRFVPALFWQGYSDADRIVNVIVEEQIKQAIYKYFPDADLSDLKYWINYSNNFGGAIQACDVKDELLNNGIASANIIENDLTQDEVWNPSDGMNSPVEQIVIDIISSSSVQAMKDWYSSTTPLSIQDLIGVAVDITNETLGEMVIQYNIILGTE